MRVLVTGGTGFIGSALCRALAAAGHQVAVVTRGNAQPSARDAVRYLPWDGAEWRAALAAADAVVNLAGEPIAAKRWTVEQKVRIRESRVQMTRRLVEAMEGAGHRPAALISASAIGYYGDRGDVPVDEVSPPGSGFLAETCFAWEAEARRAETLGVRVVRMRLGVVLAEGGGALAKMVPPFQGFLGGPLGSGRQWVSWVSRDDVIGLIQWALAQEQVQGAINATAPEPVTMRGFCRELGRALRRPSWLPAPAPAVRLLLGEMAEMLLTGQRVLPSAALAKGYAFRFPRLPDALANEFGDSH